MPNEKISDNSGLNTPYYLIPFQIYNNSGAIILNASNEVLVSEFLKNRLSFNSIYPCLKRVFRDKDFKKYAIKRSPNIKQIYDIDAWSRTKTLNIIKSKYEKYQIYPSFNNKLSAFQRQCFCRNFKKNRSYWQQTYL